MRRLMGRMPSEWIYSGEYRQPHVGSAQHVDHLERFYTLLLEEKMRSLRSGLFPQKSFADQLKAFEFHVLSARYNMALDMRRDLSVINDEGLAMVFWRELLRLSDHDMAILAPSLGMRHVVLFRVPTDRILSNVEKRRSAFPDMPSGYQGYSNGELEFFLRETYDCMECLADRLHGVAASVTLISEAQSMNLDECADVIANNVLKSSAAMCAGLP
jgi:hypothetical protein